MAAACVPLSFAAFHFLDKLVDGGEAFCQHCWQQQRRQLLQQGYSRQQSSVQPCELQRDTSWDTVFTTIMLSVVVYCLAKLSLNKLAWLLVAPSGLFLFAMLGNVVAHETDGCWDVPRRLPAVLEQ